MHISERKKNKKKRERKKHGATDLVNQVMLQRVTVTYTITHTEAEEDAKYKMNMQYIVDSY